jgi:hypothetical protein
MTDPRKSTFPEHMNSFMTTEHFTLQSARSIINSEIANRVSIYFTTLSSVIVAAAFLAQIPDMGQIMVLFGSLAIPLVILLGFFTSARLSVLSVMDATYIRAINRIRHFYYESAEEVGHFFLFPPYDDDKSVSIYGGWKSGFKDNLLSAATAVVTSNSIVLTILVMILLDNSVGAPFGQTILFALVLFLAAYVLHIIVIVTFVRPMNREKAYSEVRFPSEGDEIVV